MISLKSLASATVLILLILIGTMPFFALSEFLRIEGKHFYYREDKVFLSGVNLAWNDYARDFGNQMYNKSGPVLEKWTRDVGQAGGNVVRVWIHIEGQNTPAFDRNGFPVAPDRVGTLISDLSAFLDVAAENHVFVILVLWNGAVGIKGDFKGLVMDSRKLEAYFENALVPMVRALKMKPALGAWEIMNEPEGSVSIQPDPNPCFDTLKFRNLGPNWTNSSIPMKNLLSFVNRHSATIKKEDPKALVTLGSWSYYPQTDAYANDNTFNYYKDECLKAAGGESIGIIDFYQMHSYSWEGQWAAHAPFKVTGDSYKLDKPLVIGEFSSACSMNEGVDALWDYGYQNGYAGLWSWMYNPVMGHCSDSQEDQVRGMKRIRNCKTNGTISVKIRLTESESNCCSRGSGMLEITPDFNIKVSLILIQLVHPFINVLG